MISCLGAGGHREVNLSACSALRVRDRGVRSIAYRKACFAVSNGSDCVDLGLGEEEELKSKALGGRGIVTSAVSVSSPFR